MTQPQAPIGSQSRRIAGIGLGTIAVVIIVLIVLGGIGGVVVYQAAQQPNIQATAINTPQGTPDPNTSTVFNDERVTAFGTFDYTTTLAGTYSLVFDNSFSAFTSKSISLTYTVSGQSGSGSFTVSGGTIHPIPFAMGAGQRMYGSISVSGGGNDIDFYINAQTCTQTVAFSFTLVNSGSANGYATVRFTADGTTYWNNHYYVAIGQQLPESGSIVLGDCSSHNYNVVITQTQKS